MFPSLLNPCRFTFVSPQNRELQKPICMAYSDASELLTFRASVS